MAKTALIEILILLICDPYLPVRDRMAQAFSRIDSALCQQIYNDLRQASDSWKHFCAVHTLGFWDSNDIKSEIRSARYADSFLIRYAGDAAFEMHRRRRALQQLAERYRSRNDLARLSAYLSIKEQGDEQTLWVLRNTVPDNDSGRTFMRQLANDVNHRLRDERRKRADEEQRVLATPGMIMFD